MPHRIIHAGGRRRCMLVLLAALAAAPAARAQDAAAPWQGPRLSLSLGLALSDGEAERTFVEGPVLSADVRNGLFPDAVEEGGSGLAGGVALGYDVQRPGSPFVAGVELGLSLLDRAAREDVSEIDPEIFVGAATNSSYTTEIETLATLRLRAGYARDRTLAYLTGGLAAGRVENDLDIAIPAVGYASPEFRREDVLWGYAVGGGVERRISPRLGLRAEVLYYDLEDVEIVGADPGAFPGNRIGYEFANDGVLARLGITVGF